MNEQAFNDGQAGNNPLQPGDRIGKYEVVERVGQGGQSIVYKCHDPDLDRIVAIKQIAPQFLSDPKHREGIIQTVRKLARLGAGKEAIVDVYEMINDRSGIYYVMPFIQGYTLEVLIREAEGPMEIKAFLMIVFRLASALHEIHSVGVIHRDLKPGNIIMAPGLHPVIVDFGVAATQDGDVSIPLATTKYMAPELYENMEPDGRADIYSLGFISYEMLASREKFNEIFSEIVSEPSSESLKWMKWHGNDKVTAPLLHDVQPSVPENLSLLVDKMIQKDREQRFANAEELGRAIKTGFSSKGRQVSAPMSSGAESGPAIQYGGAAAKKAGDSGRAANIAAGNYVASEVSSSGDFAGGAPLKNKGSLGSLEGDGLDVPDGYGIMASFDQLDSGQAGPETAPLPKQPMSKGMKITLAAIAVFVIVGVTAIFLVSESLKKQAARERVEAVRNQLSSAMEVKNNNDDRYRNQRYSDTRYQNVINDFQKVVQEHGGTSEARLAKAAIVLCGAKKAMCSAIMEPDYKKAKGYYDKAAKLGREFADIKKNLHFREDKFEKELERFGNENEEIETDRLALSIVHSIISLGREEFRTTEGTTELMRLKDEITGEYKKVDDGAIPEIMVGRWDKLLVDIGRKIINGELAKKLKEARACEDANEYSRAQENYGAALDLLRSSEGRVIDGKKAEEYEKEIEKSLKRITRNVGKETAFTHYEEAGSPEARIKVIDTEILPRSDLTEEERKNFTDQRAKHNLDIKISKFKNTADPDEKKVLAKQLADSYPPAKKYLLDIEKNEQVATILKPANVAYELKDYSNAKKLYEQALEISDTEAIRNRIKKCDFYIAYKAAVKFEKAEQYEEAVEKAREALEIDKSQAEVIETFLQKIQEKMDYLSNVAKIKKYLGEGKLKEAAELIETMPENKETKQLYKDLQYKKWLRSGKRQMEQEQWEAAIFHLKKALSYNPDSMEAQRLLDEANRKKQMDDE